MAAGSLHPPDRTPKWLFGPAAVMVTRPDRTDQAGVAVDLNRREPRRASDDLAGVAPLALEQHLGVAADLVGIEAGLGGAQRRLEPGEPLCLHRFGNLWLRCCRRAGARAVLERERRSVADLVDDAERVGEVRFRLAGEADDEVAGQRDLRPGGVDAVDQAR